MNGSLLRRIHNECRREEEVQDTRNNPDCSVVSWQSICRRQVETFLNLAPMTDSLPSEIAIWHHMHNLRQSFAIPLNRAVQSVGPL